MNHNTWDNIDSADYYETVPIETFSQYAVRGGLEKGCDVDLIYPFICHKKDVLEVGAGYGRVIERLLQLRYQGHIIALERSRNFYDAIVSRYAEKSEKISILHGDAERIRLHKKFGAVLWMWSNLSEWPQHRQAAMIKKLSSWLSDDGIFVVEIIDAGQKPLNADQYTDQSYTTHTEHGAFYGYNATCQEVSGYAKAAGLRVARAIPYQTTTARKRFILLLTFGRNADAALQERTVDSKPV